MAAPPGAGRRYDAVVVGSGVAGCATALHLARAGARVAMVTKDGLGVSTTAWAQGGVAAALPDTGDRPEDHLVDTLRAGAGLCDPAATRLLVEAAPAAVADLLEAGARLDREPDGQLARAREGGHGMARVVHAGGAATGAEIVRALVAALEASTVEVFAGWLVGSLVVSAGRCTGVAAAVAPPGVPRRLEAGAVVVATGGAGQLFALTTNPAGSTGDGVGLALAAGVPVADLELFQFHPTALAVEASPRPLLSEALRGEGATLVGADGRRFVDELLPRDQVARAVARQMAADGTDHVWLDARSLPAFNRRFPSLATALAAVGLDAERSLLPVAPAAHFLCGGILTDLDGATALSGCYAVGEVACSGVHGANRLASNSLLEGLVFGRRAAAAILGGASGPSPTGALGPLLGGGEASALPVRALVVPPPTALSGGWRARRGEGGAVAAGGVPDGEAGEGMVEERRAAIRSSLGLAMTAGAGVVRDGAGLTALGQTIEALAEELAGLGDGGGRAGVELANLLRVGAAAVALGKAREESRGAHYRADHPETSDAWRCRLAIVAGAGTGEGGRDAP